MRGVVEGAGAAVEKRSAEESPTGPFTRALAVIDFVAGSRRPPTVAEIAEGLSLPLTSAHRLVGGLADRGLLQHPLGSKRFEIGDRMVDFAARVLGASLSGSGRHAVLRDLAERVGEQCEISIVRHGRVVHVGVVTPFGASGLRFDPGAEAPLHCSPTGKLYLSRMSTASRERLVRSLDLERLTERTIVDPEVLLEELRATRRRGWAISDGELAAGVVGCAVPVLGPHGTLIAGLGVSAPAARVVPAGLQYFVPAMMRAAERLAPDAAATEDIARPAGPTGSAARHGGAGHGSSG